MSWNLFDDTNKINPFSISFADFQGIGDEKSRPVEGKISGGEGSVHQGAGPPRFPGVPRAGHGVHLRRTEVDEKIDTKREAESCGS